MCLSVIVVLVSMLAILWADLDRLFVSVVKVITQNFCGCTKVVHL